MTSRILFASSRLSPIGGSIAGLIGVGLPEALVGSSEARTASRLSGSSSEMLNDGGSGFELSSLMPDSRSPCRRDCSSFFAHTGEQYSAPVTCGSAFSRFCSWSRWIWLASR